MASADGPGEYEVAFEAFAGVAPGALAPGQVAYIGTGGPVPAGADAVVQIEDTEFLGGGGEGGGGSGGSSKRVRITKAVAPGTDIRPVRFGQGPPPGERRESAATHASLLPESFCPEMKALV